MKPRIETLKGKKLAGKRLVMSFSAYTVHELWSKFMPHRREITNNLTNDLISMAVYSPGFFENFNPSAEFEKWAAVEVSDFEGIPVGMDYFLLKGGSYAVFDYRGPGNDNKIFEYIYRKWLLGSEYFLDDRPHFEILGDKYKNNAPDSEEEIWIPVRMK